MTHLRSACGTLLWSMGVVWIEANSTATKRRYRQRELRIMA
jgi:hypothetical protein